MIRKNLLWKCGKGSRARMNILCNTPIQGLAGDGMKQAMVEIWELIKDRHEIKPVTVVHDEVVMECPLSEAHEVTQTIKNAMTKGMQHYLKEVPIEVDSCISANWWEG
jgi:DNA polymerase-1